jgi:hypothetical protein
MVCITRLHEFCIRYRRLSFIGGQYGKDDS